MKVAVAGTGRMGAFRARVLAEHPEVEQVVVGSRDPERGAHAAGAIGAAAVPLGELFDRPLDAVVISTETGTHPALVLECAERGLPVLCEKPIALGVELTEQMVYSLERSGATVQVAFQRRFDPAFARVREAVAAGELGVLYAMRLAAHDHEPSPEHYIPTSGGIWLDLHVHDFDLARWITGLEVACVYASGTVRLHERFAKHEDFDSTAAVLTMSDGLRVVVTGARHDPRGYDFRVELFGSKDTLSAGLDRRAPVRYVDDEERTVPASEAYTGFLDRFSEAFRAETEAFIDLVQGRRENPCPPRESLQSTRVAVACAESARRGCEVAVGA